MNTESPVSVTLPAYAADTLDETLSIWAWEPWIDRIAALAEFTCYGPAFHRGVVESLERVSHSAGQQRWMDAELSLQVAERIAGTRA